MRGNLQIRFPFKDEENSKLFDSERKVRTLLQSAMERMRYSDEILAIYKYLHR